MNTVTDQTDLQARVIFDRAEIDRLRWFQGSRYFESGLIDTLPTHLVDDGHVASSTYFGVYRGNEVCGTVRIVQSDSDLPMLKYHSFFPEIQDYLTSERSSVAEVSRLAVGRKTRPNQALLLLMRELFRFGFHNQEATLMVASVEQPLVRILNRMIGMPLPVIGPSIGQYGDFKGACVPILIDTVKCLESFRQQESRNWAFFTEGLAIDLTDGSPSTPAGAHEVEVLTS